MPASSLRNSSLHQVCLLFVSFSQISILKSSDSSAQYIGKLVGNYHCSRKFLIAIAMGVAWLESFIGNLLVSMIADNFGRRVALLSCIAEAIVGYGIMLLASDLITAEFGIFVAGCGLQGLFPVIICVFEEILDNERIQKLQVLVQAFRCIGDLFLCAMFYILEDWKPIILYCSFLPLIVSFIFTWLYFKETPLFLIKLYQVEDIRKDLLFIAQQNGKLDLAEKCQALKTQALQKYKQDYYQELFCVLR